MFSYIHVCLAWNLLLLSPASTPAWCWYSNIWPHTQVCSLRTWGKVLHQPWVSYRSLQSITEVSKLCYGSNWFLVPKNLKPELNFDFLLFYFMIMSIRQRKVETDLEPISQKSRKLFRLEKTICETVNRLFWKADLLTCFQGMTVKFDNLHQSCPFLRQRELWHPKMARKVLVPLRNGPLVWKILNQ